MQAKLFASPAAAGQGTLFAAEGPSTAVLDLLRRLRDGAEISWYDAVARLALANGWIEIVDSRLTLTPRGAAQLRG